MTKRAIRVLIVQRDRAYGDLLAQRFRSAGFEVIQCVGPHSPGYHCYLLDARPPSDPSPAAPYRAGYDCPLVEEADVLVYDPWLYVSADSRDAGPLLQALRRRYPLQPLVLTWAMEGLPATEPVTTGDPGLYIGPSDPEKLVQFVSTLRRQPLAKDDPPSA